jgi:glutamate-ammonia-ligase adenylyltransferase
MRLRPSGNKGPVAVSLTAFRSYHAAEAWTWERMALTRARVVTGPPPLCAAIEAALAEALAGADAARVRPDAAAMRARMERELPATGKWDVKHRVGGQVDVEFVVQTGLLLTPAARPAPTIRAAIARLEAAGALTDAEAAILTEADHFWRTVQGMLRITIGARPPAELPEAAWEALLRATEIDDEPAFHTYMERLAARVRAVFGNRVGCTA